MGGNLTWSLDGDMSFIRYSCTTVAVDRYKQQPLNITQAVSSCPVRGLDVQKRRFFDHLFKHYVCSSFLLALLVISNKPHQLADVPFSAEMQDLYQEPQYKSISIPHNKSVRTESLRSVSVGKKTISCCIAAKSLYC